MLVEPGELLGLMRLPPDTPLDAEPMHTYPSLAERVVAGTGANRQVVVVRTNLDPELANNLLAVTETLDRLKFAHMPRPLATWGRCLIEEDVPAASALAIEPPAGSLEAAVDALAALHALTTVEGIRWGATPADLYPREWQLFRLGFASHEREPAEQLLLRACERLLYAPVGFTHGNSTAERVLLGNGRAWLADFSFAGYGSQLCDLVAFALTTGIGPAARLALAERYNAARGLPNQTVALYELAEVAWGLDWLLGLARRMMTVHGDDAASASVRLQADRIERGVRAGIGVDSLASSIGQALWPG